VLLDIIVTP